MSDYRFNFQIADATLYDMDHVTKHVKSVLEDLERDAEASIKDWTGDARDAYWKAKAEWDQQAAAMPVYLEAGRKALLQISDNYGTTEQRAQMIWNDVRGG
ncbi:hypothetical protein GCM10011581_45350 [Saccharopolyspora subtropica]|uniref:ESAT-6-like protein n=1 Tax=Saccharopolyspora thermophila TaxID=89367 RepID=A0A917K6S6_9PSEU|nr:WXG100 family type VII secretion target [Saccharopolyspora subtropica]GGJ03138.1 hypothetical protein GCM10011581_45350 [Saccharopolyspora subtropica]